MVGTRWQPPRLHTAHEGEGERKITWLELFYDLVYVATIIQLGNVLSNNVSLLGFLGFVALFIPIWWSWTGITFYLNRFVVDDVWHRLLIFTQIFAIAILAISAEAAIGERASQFALAYVAVRMVLVALYLRSGRHVEHARPLTNRYAWGFSLAALFWLISAFVPSPFRYILWVVGMGIDFGVAVSPGTRKLHGLLPPDVPHMSERYGIFTIIVLGEAFVKVIGGASEEQLGFSSAILGIFGLAVACSLWWLYFDDVAGAAIRPVGLAPYVWIYSHLPLAIGLIAFAVGIKEVIVHPGDLLEAQYRWLISGAIALCLVFIALIDLVTTGASKASDARDSKVRAFFRFGSAAVVLLLAIFGGWLSPIIFIALVALACVIQIVIDLSMESKRNNVAVAAHGKDAAISSGE